MKCGPAAIPSLDRVPASWGLKGGIRNIVGSYIFAGQHIRKEAQIAEVFGLESTPSLVFSPVTLHFGHTSQRGLSNFYCSIQFHLVHQTLLER